MELDLGGRKFLFALLVVFLTFILAVLGKITFDQFLNTEVWALGIFAASNAISKFSDISITKTTD
ncbi:hypothetical protein KJ934_00325 [Patescibacteria group bacterium]|nr:hypothetical protein [Patescibacteria group bacterium]MBU4353382.1 hypothetical protein [Patescibacteria group bacterium]MBU4477462.1 hypothetical protein [Patescibacteria group bacterium]MCG2699128.1 hypothetical protein [Candidatus Parcubacteria bacterium]